MKSLSPMALVLVVSLVILTGCQTPAEPAAPVRPASPAEPFTIGKNCYGLLHQLLSDQKNVGLLRFVKREKDDVTVLIKKIAATSGAGAKLLEELAHRNPTITLGDLRLPPGETATRDAIAATKKKAILGQAGGSFELTLLLTQTEALSYGWHLAKVAAENEPVTERARALAGIAKDMEDLYHEVYALLLSKYAYQP